MVCTLPVNRSLGALLERIQHDLFAIGAELATPDPDKSRTPRVGLPEIAQLESAIDRLEEGLAPLKQFILPGGSSAGAMLHLARTVCRRAERRVVELGQVDTHLASHVLVYLNRLGDLLFVAARSANWDAGCQELPWRPTS
jgi:cob(I)alamin adenosyltransferase